MPTVHVEAGFRFGFRMNDGRFRRSGALVERPHVHVKGHGGRMKVWLDDVTVAVHRGLTEADIRRVLAIVHDHRAEMLAAWREAFGE